MAISAPVLPADSAASALPSFTALIAMPIEVVVARRIAWLGFSLGVDGVGGVDGSSTAPIEVGVALAARRAISFSSPKTQEVQRRGRVRRARAMPGEHGRRAGVAAHGVDRDARACVHRASALVRAAAQASVETISRPL